MSKRMQSKQKMAMKTARGLKRKKQNYLIQAIIAMLVSFAGALAPWILYSIGYMSSNDWYILAIALVVLAAGGFVSNNRVQKFRDADKSLKECCERFSLNIADVA